MLSEEKRLKYSMLVSGCHFARARIKRLKSSFVEYAELSTAIVNLSERDEHFLMLITSIKESASTDDETASQNYQRLISEFRKGIKDLDVFIHQISIEQYPLLRTVIKEVSSGLQEDIAGASHTTLDAL